ncbi:hypothetical protein ACO229_06600 [Promicromonospora sp. MS192]|uniref:hypothetical protein n=1 Tax=Promicromonospora sp. MS192 TaxID=3412684 RepID=UPI003C2CD5A3
MCSTPDESPTGGSGVPAVDLTIPTPALVRALTDRQVDATDEAWWQVKNSDDYLSGRAAVMRAAGYEMADLSDLIEANTDLAGLQQAVKDRLGGRPTRSMKALTSSTRWAYLAHAHAEFISDVQSDALRAGWVAAVAPSQPRHWWSFLRRPAGPARSRTVRQ